MYMGHYTIHGEFVKGNRTTHENFIPLGKKARECKRKCSSKCKNSVCRKSCYSKECKKGRNLSNIIQSHISKGTKRHSSQHTSHHTPHTTPHHTTKHHTTKHHTAPHHTTPHHTTPHHTTTHNIPQKPSPQSTSPQNIPQKPSPLHHTPEVSNGNGMVSVVNPGDKLTINILNKITDIKKKLNSTDDCILTNKTTWKIFTILEVLIKEINKNDLLTKSQKTIANLTDLNTSIVNIKNNLHNNNDFKKNVDSMLYDLTKTTKKYM